MTDVSISIVTYNNGGIIKGTVNNLINHLKDIDYKIYLIDNNSQDRTINILKNIENCNKKILAIVSLTESDKMEYKKISKNKVYKIPNPLPFV